MRHEQQDPAPRSLLPLCLLLMLSIVLLLFNDYYEQQQAYQWEQMLRQRWQRPVTPLTLPAPREANAADDMPVVTGSVDLQAGSAELPAREAVASPAVPMPTAVDAAPAQAVAPARPAGAKPAHQRAVQKPLALKLPEQLYRDDMVKLEDEPPLPDLFAPKQVNPGRLQLGGRLITEEEVQELRQKKDAQTDLLDTVKGAELNISIKTD